MAFVASNNPNFLIYRINKFMNGLPENWLVITIASGFVGLLSYLWNRKDKRLTEAIDKLDKLLIHQQELTGSIKANKTAIDRVSATSDIHASHIATLNTTVAVLNSKFDNLNKKDNES